MSNDGSTDRVNALVEAMTPPANLVTIKAFFETFPPGRVGVTNERRTADYLENGRPVLKLPTPELLLFCSSAICNGDRVFRSSSNVRTSDFPHDGFVDYRCDNCRAMIKTFAVRWDRADREGYFELSKFGEQPPFGAPTPTRLLTLLGDEKDQFLKGRRCEHQNMGIAAFAYYRRVVENRKATIIGEIARVAKALSNDSALLVDLERAQAESQFSRAVEAVKHAIPELLLINGHNPLTLLHNALSGGLHGSTDAECLEIATDVRVVLSEFVERVAAALKDEATLKTAVTRLMANRSASAAPEARDTIAPPRPQ